MSTLIGDIPTPIPAGTVLVWDGAKFASQPTLGCGYGSGAGASQASLAASLTTSPTAANRCGFWANTATPGAEQVGIVVGGVQGPTFTVASGLVGTSFPGSLTLTGGGTQITISPPAGGAAVIALNPPSGQDGTIQWQQAGTNYYTMHGNNLHWYLNDNVNGWAPINYGIGTQALGVVSFSGTLDAGSSTNAGAIFGGGVGIAKSLQVGTTGTFGGNVNIGGNLSVTGSFSFSGSQSFSSTGSTNGSIGLLVTVSGTYAGAGTVKGMSGVLNYAPSGATTATYTGTYGTVSANVAANGGLLVGMTQFGTLGAAATGTYGNLWGNYTTLTNTGAAILTLGVGYYAESAVNSGGGSITTYVAIQINSQTAAATNYAIRSSGMGLVSFADTTTAATSIIGAFVVGNGTASTSVAIGGGKINIGGTLTVGALTTVTTASNNQLTLVSSTGNGGFTLQASTGTAATIANTGTLFAVYNGTSNIFQVNVTGGAVGACYLGASANPAANTFGGNFIWGRNNASADTAGCVGESIASNPTPAVTGGTSGTPNNLTSISLTAGKWLICGGCTFAAGAPGFTAGSNLDISIATTSATMTSAQPFANINIPSATSGACYALTIPFYIININAAATYYLNFSGTWTGGSPTVAPSLTAVRIA